MLQIIGDKKMTAEQFCYWLQGYMEMSEAEKLDEKQVKIMKDHLALVFDKVTPDYDVTTATTIDWKGLDLTGPSSVIC